MLKIRKYWPKIKKKAVNGPSGVQIQKYFFVFFAKNIGGF